MNDPNDVASRLHYRRHVAWPSRIAREWPLIESLLESAPSGRVLDLGCGTGEHARFLEARGYDVVGIDRSAAQLAAARQARAAAGRTGPRFVEGDLTALDDLVKGRFGFAICLGNTLPHLDDETQLDAFLAGLRRHLAPGGTLLMQLLNYHRIFDRGIVALPVDTRADEDGGAFVFVRMVEALAGRPGPFQPEHAPLPGWRRSATRGRAHANVVPARLDPHRRSTKGWRVRDSRSASASAPWIAIRSMPPTRSI